MRSEAEASRALCLQCGEHMGMVLQGLYWLCALLALGTHRHKVAVRPLGTTEAAVGMQNHWPQITSGFVWWRTIQRVVITHRAHCSKSPCPPGQLQSARPVVQHCGLGP